MIMKRLVTLISVVFTFSGLQAQIKMSSNGNVGIQSSVVPEAALVVGGNASHKGTGYKTYIQSDGYVLNVRREGNWKSASPWLVASEGYNEVDGDDFYIGVKGISMHGTARWTSSFWWILRQPKRGGHSRDIRQCRYRCTRPLCRLFYGRHPYHGKYLRYSTDTLGFPFRLDGAFGSDAPVGGKRCNEQHVCG